MFDMTRLEALPVPALAGALAPIDRASLSDAETVALLRARQRLINHLMAERAADMVEVCVRHEGSPIEALDQYGEFAPLEVGSALTLTRRSAEAEVGLAFDLVTRLPAVWEAVHAGDLDWPRARAIVRSVEHLADADARRVVDEVLAIAPTLTTGQLASRLRRATLEAEPSDAADRFEAAVEARRVETWPRPDGTGDLIATGLPPDRLNQAFDHIDRLARRLHDDGRTLDQRRVDVLLDLLTGSAPGATCTDLVVTVDLETLVGLADRAAEIPGWGPTIADIARQALGEGPDGRLRVRVDDADASVDVTTRRPTAAQRRQVRRRFPRCVFPGCRMPARKADLDHVTRHVDGGPTHTGNLAPLCRHHHRAKDEGRWRYCLVGRTIVWTSPLGLTYTVEPRGP
ncbi:MAG: DUF222 domain-containing protein [Acidimicrobiia bacterium]